MSYFKKIIILSKIAKNTVFEREPTGFVKLERANGSITGRAALLNLSAEGLVLGIKCKNLPLQSFSVSAEPETVFTLHSASQIETAVCVVARETAAGFTALLSGGGDKSTTDTLALAFPKTKSGGAEATAVAAARNIERTETSARPQTETPAPHKESIQDKTVTDVHTDPQNNSEANSAPVNSRIVPPPFLVPPVTPINDEQIAETNYFEAAAALADSVSPRARSHAYYRSISAELEELFALFPPEETLTRLIDGAYFARVNYVGDKYYAVGLISAGDEPQYIAYAVPGIYSPQPPAELRDSCRWIPAKYSDYTGAGYWVMYQDTDTGETVIAD